MYRIPGVLTSLLSSSPGARSFRSTLLWTMLCLPAAAIPYHGAFDATVPFMPDGHAYVGIGLAVSAEYCGKPGLISNQHNIGMRITNDPRMLRTPFPDLLVILAGTREAYCETVQIPFLNNENSMMLLMRAVLRAWPRASPADLGRCLSILRLALGALLALALLRAGAAVPFTIAALLALFDIVCDLRFFQFSIYSMFVPLLTGMLAFYVLALPGEKTAGHGWATAMFLAAGFLSAFAGNMRSSHAPIYAALFIGFAAVLRGRLTTRAPLPAYVLLATLCFATSYWAFGRIFIAPITPDRSATFQNYSFHPIAHPLVLSLAIPPGSLSRREGIQWDDTVGPILARRMVPDAVYLGPGYEEGLFLYYLKLWLVDPQAMLHVYRRKLDLAGTGMFARPGTPMESQRVGRALAGLGTIDRGRYLLLLYLLSASVAYWWYRRTHRVLAAFWLLAATAAVLMFTESAITVSAFYLQYHGFLLFFTAALALGIGQACLDVALYGLRRVVKPHVDGGAGDVRLPDRGR